MFKKIFKFIAGYVIIEITGKNRERFVSMCLHNHLAVSDVIPTGGGLRMTMLRADFPKIRRLVRKCGVRVRIISVHGLKEWRKRYGRRCGFFTAGLIVCIFFLIIPHYIWYVEIDGLYASDSAQIMDILRRHNVYVGAQKRGIDDLKEIKNDIVAECDGINWAWLYVEGAKARLQIQEVSSPPAIRDTAAATDIIAVCDGFVRRADVLRGERRVNCGDTVMAGDTLVSGKVAVFREGYPENYIYVHADADIQADTIRRESGRFSTTERLRIRTGKIKRRFSVCLFGKEFRLFKTDGGGFEDYDEVRNDYRLTLPAIGDTGNAFTVHHYYEVTETEHPLTEQEVLSRARETLEERICKKLTRGAVKQEDELTYNTDGEIYDVELRMYLRENIGVEIPTEE